MKQLALIFVVLMLSASIVMGGDYQFAPPGLTGKIPTQNESYRPPPAQTDDWVVTDSIWVNIYNPTGLTYDGNNFWITNY